MEGWLTCLAELSIPKDNPAWAKAALTPVFPESLVPYSPMILLKFDEEEFFNWLEEEEDVDSNMAANLTVEVRRMVAKESEEKSVKDTREDAREDAARNPPPKL